jgi:hypothetical protein
MEPALCCYDSTNLRFAAQSVASADDTTRERFRGFTHLQFIRFVCENIPSEAAFAALPPPERIAASHNVKLNPTKFVEQSVCFFGAWGHPDQISKVVSMKPAVLNAEQQKEPSPQLLQSLARLQRCQAIMQNYLGQLLIGAALAGRVGKILRACKFIKESITNVAEYLVAAATIAGHLDGVIAVMRYIPDDYVNPRTKRNKNDMTRIGAAYGLLCVPDIHLFSHAEIASYIEKHTGSPVHRMAVACLRVRREYLAQSGARSAIA